MARRIQRVQLAEVVRVLPRRAHDLSRKTVNDSQRWRLLEAMVEAVAKSGYAEASVADVIAIAGVSRKTFYEHFTDKEDCFLKAYEVVAERLLGLVIAAGDAQPAGAKRRRALVGRFLEGLKNDPPGARVCLVEGLAAGPRVLRLFEHTTDQFARVLLGDEISDVRRAAIAGGIHAVVLASVLEGKVAQLPAMTDELADFVERARR